MLKHLLILLQRLVLNHCLRVMEEQGQSHHENSGHKPRHPQTEPSRERTAEVSENVHI